MFVKTKIDERREREAYELAHPWLPMAQAVIDDGVVCELLFSDMVVTNKRYFLGEGDAWYQIEPPAEISTWGRKPMNWRPVSPATKLTFWKRAEIKRLASQGGL
jgi:hypothetical protein